MPADRENAGVAAGSQPMVTMPAGRLTVHNHCGKKGSYEPVVGAW